MNDDAINHRQHLLSLAYKILGSLSDAEDQVQETWLRFQAVDQAQVLNRRAYLSRITTHLCLDVLRKREKMSDKYVGPWLPEPLYTELDEGCMEHGLEFPNDLSIALLFMLERLKPSERAVFVLKEAFGYKHNQIAEMLDINTSASRQVLSRAKRSLSGTEPDRDEKPLSSQKQRDLIERIMQSLVSGDTVELRSLLSEDVTAYTDGGGQVSAALIPLRGKDRVIQVFSHLAKKFTAGNFDVEWRRINNELGLVLQDNEGLVSVMSFEFDGEQLKGIYVQRNPTKLKNFIRNSGR